jgi:DNA-binding LacI/PurR family transcriptional regulator
MEDRLMGKTPTIGYFNMTLAQEWAYIPWTGIVARARERGVRLLSFHGNTIKAAEGDAKETNILYDLAKKGRLDGLVTWKGHLTAALDETEIFRFCQSYGIPTVTIEGKVQDLPAVTYGNVEGMRMATDHLIEGHGCRSLAFVGVSDFHVFAQRLTGFKRSLEAHGLGVEEKFLSPELPWERGPDGRPPEESFDPWLKGALASGVRGFLGVCDPVALWIIERAEAMGLNVPKDLAVAGFDGFVQSRVALPSITTVNPDWEGLGAAALDAVLDLINGKAVEGNIAVKPKLVRARSCGCVEENVLRAGEGRRRVRDTGKAYEEIFRRVAGERALSLVPAFAASRRTGSPEPFLDALDEGLRSTIKAGDDPQTWQDAITELAKGLRRRIQSLLPGARADALFHQARILISDAVEHSNVRKAMGASDQEGKERDLGLALITSFDSRRILDALASGLPGLGIPSAWMSFYEDPRSYAYPERAPEWSKLVLAVEGGSRIELPEAGLRFRTHELIPDTRWPKDPRGGNYVVEALHFHDTQIGFIVMQADLIKGPLYRAIATQIGAGLQGTRLLMEIERHSAALEAGVAGLSVSGEQMFRSMEAVAASVSKQAEAVQDEAGSIEELDRNIAGISGISKDSLSVSRELDRDAIEGSKSVKSLLSVMDKFQKESDSIMGLIGLIQEFADMTKLLAFNAAVEAAHLGAAGKGFNVIATDIRKLAENADSSVKRIGEVVGRVAALIEESAGISRRTGSGLESILDFSKKNAQASSQVNGAMEEQARGVGAILESTRKLTDITAEIKEAIGEQTKAMGDLRDALALLRAGAAPRTLSSA